MRKFYILGILALAVVIIGFAWAEQVTLTTYYPAPYGVYREFTTTSNTNLAITDGNVGIGTMNPQAKLEVAGEILFAPLSQPAFPQPGMIYYDQTEHVLRYYKGGLNPGWVDIDGAGGFADWIVMGTNIPGGAVYGPAATDGIVTAHAWDGHLQGYTDASSNPTTMVIRHNLYHSGSGSGITFPVKKGHYWKVETQGGDGLIDALYWIPFGR